MDSCRLKDVIWDSSRLFLVMEYMDLDFSEYMASQANQLSLPKIRVSLSQAAATASGPQRLNTLRPSASYALLLGSPQ